MERNGKSRLMGAAGTLLALFGMVLAPISAQAGADGRKNTTIALGAAAAWELLHHQTLAGVALGAGAVVAEKKYEDARQSERDANNRQRYYRNGVPYGAYSNNNYGNNNYRYSPRPNAPYYGGDNNNPYYNGNNNNSYGNNGDYDSSQNYGQSQNQSYYRHGNNGQSNGRKQGWNGHSMPPGQWKKAHRDHDGDNN